MLKQKSIRKFFEVESGPSRNENIFVKSIKRKLSEIQTESQKKKTKSDDGKLQPASNTSISTSELNDANLQPVSNTSVSTSELNEKVVFFCDRE